MNCSAGQAGTHQFWIMVLQNNRYTMITKITRLFFLLLFAWATTVQAQVNGNTRLETHTYSFETFSRLNISTPAQVYIVADSDKATVQITTDQNIFSHLPPQISGDEVTIEPDRWIEPSQLTITVSTRMLRALTTGGYGTYEVTGLRADSFFLDNPVGTVLLSGVVNTFDLQLENGKVDARQLRAQNVDATITGHGLARLNVQDFLHASIWDNGTIIYEQKPYRIERDLSDQAKLLAADAYQKQVTEARDTRNISFRLRNNSSQRISALVQGPAGRRFSYGFALHPLQKRTEEWPIGTRVFQVSKLGAKKLLVTIAEKDEGQVVDLF